LIDSAAQIGDGPSQLLAMIDAHCSKGALLAAQSFLKQLDIGIDGNGWAITDVPLEISANGERIHVRRAPGTSLDSDDLADSAFIEARVLTYPERLNPTERYTECLYRAIPTLTRASYDWSRLNRFACVFAVVRWACDNGAACDTDPAIPAAERLPTPDAIVVDRQSVLPSVPIGEQERIALVRAKMEAALGRIGRRIDTTTLKTVQDECDKSIALWRRVLAMYRDKIIAVNDDSKVPQRVWNEYLSLISESESKRLALARFDPLAQSWIKLSILKAEVLPPYLR